MLNRLKAYGISETGLARVKVRGYDDLVIRVCAHHGVTPAQVTQRGVRGTPSVSAARGDLCRRFYADGQSLKEIGRMLQLDHTTVLHHVRQPASSELYGPITPFQARRETLTFPKERTL